MNQIITSLLDQDLYKLTMQQAVFHHFSNVTAEYAFKCRTKGIDFSQFLEEINHEIDRLCELRFQKGEIEYLASIPFLKRDFIDLLRIFQLNRDHVTAYVKDGDLNVDIKGGWLFTILFEVPLLAIISEVYLTNKYPHPNYEGAMTRLEEKMTFCHANPSVKFADFGTRRRFSHDWQKRVVGEMSRHLVGSFIGTSNVYFARKFGVKPIGTMAHEYLQAGQALVPVINSQKFMLQKWMDEYEGSLGIALTDVITSDAFLQDFDKRFAQAYDGVRQDSGDPYEFGEKIIKHYKDLGINPLDKTIVFSDGLTFEKARSLLDAFAGRINVSFGIGTNLTNDFPNQDPIQIVIKMIKCNGSHVAKISDSQGKTMCRSQTYLSYLKEVFNVK